MAEENKPVEVPKEEAPATITEAVAATETPAQPEIKTEETAAPAGMCDPLLLFLSLSRAACAHGEINDHESREPLLIKFALS